ncbi:hypothetical protein Avbf_03042 [Armadillidium vulgare]|nr:hypothetical protein Avbf_03042 [Armadillidium vulgare]
MESLVEVRSSGPLLHVHAAAASRQAARKRFVERLPPERGRRGAEAEDESTLLSTHALTLDTNTTSDEKPRTSPSVLAKRVKSQSWRIAPSLSRVRSRALSCTSVQHPPADKLPERRFRREVASGASVGEGQKLRREHPSVHTRLYARHNELSAENPRRDLRVGEDVEIRLTRKSQVRPAVRLPCSAWSRVRSLGPSLHVRCSIRQQTICQNGGFVEGCFRSEQLVESSEFGPSLHVVQHRQQTSCRKEFRREVLPERRRVAELRREHPSSTHAFTLGHNELSAENPSEGLSSSRGRGDPYRRGHCCLPVPPALPESLRQSRQSVPSRSHQQPAQKACRPHLPSSVTRGLPERA